MNEQWAAIEGGVTAPQGFRAAGVAAGIKGPGRDVALVVSDAPATLAGTFTRNAVAAAPVILCRERVAQAQARAIVVNSGSANAWTGPQGRADAARMAFVAAGALGLSPEEVCVCSTGTIGVPLPMDRVEAGIRAAVEALADDGGSDAAEAIMTTDTVPKTVALELSLAGQTVRLGAMAKGAGMIEPNMATMLAFLTCDAAVDAVDLQALLIEAVDRSFNAITVDGDQSTNDTVLMLANGRAGTPVLNATHPDWVRFRDAVYAVTLELALQIVRDGEGATKLVTVQLTGAETDADAQRAARQIANSLLVKTAWFGADPNWGRIVDALGHSGATIREETVRISFDQVCAVEHGVRTAAPLADLESVLKQDTFTVAVDLGIGKGQDTVYTCDISEEYVRINAEYTT